MFEYHPDPDVQAARGGFWVVTAISNPERYRSRYELYKRFRAHVLHDLKANLCTVECQLGDRGFQVTGSAAVVQPLPGTDVQALDVQVRNNSYIWLKENLLNLGVQRLPSSCQYVLFCDADITFQNPSAVEDIIHALQAHPVVHPFETAADLGPHGEVMQLHKSFGWCHAQGMQWTGPAAAPCTGPAHGGYGVDAYGYGKPRGGGGNGRGNMWHPGYAMAFRMSALRQLRGLPEMGILGAGDHHFCLAVIGKAACSCPPGVHPAYKEAVLAYQSRAQAALDGDMGYVRGLIHHSFHGAKKNRRYKTRWECLVDSKYDPTADVYKNLQGVLEVESGKHQLRDSLRRYFKQRQEDCISM